MLAPCPLFVSSFSFFAWLQGRADLSIRKCSLSESAKFLLVSPAYRPPGIHCSSGQDISSAHRSRSTPQGIAQLPHNRLHRKGGRPIPMFLTFAKRVSECPVCESSSVRRSRRKGFVERIWFRLAFVWPYRCKSCDTRFWGFHRSYSVVTNEPAFAVARNHVRRGAAQG